MAEEEHESALDELAVRVPRIRDAHSYGIVLGLVLVTFVFADVASTATWTGSVIVLLQAITLAVALATSGRPNIRLAASVGVVAAVIVAVAELNVHHGRVTDAGFALVSAALTVAIAAAVGHGVTRQPEINSASVCGAIVVYLQIGMLFVFVYGAINAIHPPFFAQGTAATRSLLLYFSYVTLATLGYGDYTPAGQVGKTFAVIEALVGQLYLVTVVAVLVAGFGRAKPSTSEDSNGG
jgi:hypothetical protein